MEGEVRIGFKCSKCSTTVSIVQYFSFLYKDNECRCPGGINGEQCDTRMADYKVVNALVGGETERNMDKCKCKCSGSCGKSKVKLDNTVAIWLPPSMVKAIKNVNNDSPRHIAVVETGKDSTYYLDGDAIETIKN